MLAQLCALRTHDVRVLFSLETLSSAALFQETMVCSLGNVKKKEEEKKWWSPQLLRPHLGWTQHTGLWHNSQARRFHPTHGAWVHHISLEPSAPLLPQCLFSFLSSIFSNRVVMKGSMLIQDEEIICWPPGDFKKQHCY